MQFVNHPNTREAINSR